MDIFRDIHLILHPPTQREATTRQPQVPIQVSVSFKLCMDLKSSILQHDYTLKEVEHFLEKFTNYMKSGANQIIPAGALYAQVCVNVDNYWLTEIRERVFSRGSPRISQGIGNFDNFC